MVSLNGPQMTEKQISEYLARIDIEKPDKLTPEYLKRLQYAHISHIPFENIDIIKGNVELSLDREHLFDKIIIKGRGGVCSELNTLYNWLLESLGFDVVSYISRIIAKTAPIQQVSHRVMVVDFGGERYLTDVGFNYDHHRIPLLLKEGLVQYDGECHYRLEKDPVLGWIMHQKTAIEWRGKISFYECPRLDMDFIGPTFFAQHHPASKINKKLKVSIHKDNSFYAIREGCFLKENEGMIEELEKIESYEREEQLLKDVFGLRLD